MATDSKPSTKPYQIVVGFDFSELGQRAFQESLDIARRRAPAELHVVTVAQPIGTLVGLPGDPNALTEAAATETVKRKIADLVAEEQASRGAVGLERIAVYVLTGIPAGEPGKLITDLASAVDADLIVVGTHGRKGLSRALLGSVAAHVVRDATTSVYVVRPPDFVGGEKVPAIAPPLQAGESPLKHFEHRRTYHYVDKVSAWTARTMPVS